jgi:hypothetical protein
MEGFIHTFLANPELAVFLTLAVGFRPGNLQIGRFSPVDCAADIKES